MSSASRSPISCTLLQSPGEKTVHGVVFEAPRAAGGFRHADRIDDQKVRRLSDERREHEADGAAVDEPEARIAAETPFQLTQDANADAVVAQQHVADAEHEDVRGG